ncbi:MAG: 2-C-methyl-D-erythritol 4-phosphate cytidylyltransferase, partial [Candidatus Rokubacteria bacterium]|nr:2-C-methyl-D-erythritol 4-phosphate cytidylyltransferase [Candidatus Rokubacteria bacterium]
ETVEREGLWTIQTPQAFRLSLLREAHARAEAEGVQGTDDAVLVERLGHPVRLVTGLATNLKITRPEELELARALLRRAGRRGP